MLQRHMEESRFSVILRLKHMRHLILFSALAFPASFLWRGQGHQPDPLKARIPEYETILPFLIVFVSILQKRR